MGDGSSMDFGFDPGAGALPDYGQDLAQTGSGADPFGGGDGLGGTGAWTGASFAAEAAPSGAFPGGTDSQLTPFSPGGGYDFTDVLRGGARLLGVGARLADSSSRWDVFRGGTTGPNLGVGPQVSRSVSTYQGQYSGQAIGEIVKWVRQSSGLRVTAASIVGLIVRYGFKAAGALTKLDMSALLAIFMSKKGVRHRRRGPGLYTVARKLRAADRMQATVSRILHRGAHHRARARRAPYHAFKRRR